MAFSARRDSSLAPLCADALRRTPFPRTRAVKLAYSCLACLRVPKRRAMLVSATACAPRAADRLLVLYRMTRAHPRCVRFGTAPSSGPFCIVATTDIARHSQQSSRDHAIGVVARVACGRAATESPPAKTIGGTWQVKAPNAPVHKTCRSSTATGRGSRPIRTPAFHGRATVMVRVSRSRRAARSMACGSR